MSKIQSLPLIVNQTRWSFPFSKTTMAVHNLDINEKGESWLLISWKVIDNILQSIYKRKEHKYTFVYSKVYLEKYQGS